MADHRVIHEHAVEKKLDSKVMKEIETMLVKLEAKGRDKIAEENIMVKRKVHVRYEGSDASLYSGLW